MRNWSKSVYVIDGDAKEVNELYELIKDLGKGKNLYLGTGTRRTTAKASIFLKSAGLKYLHLKTSSWPSILPNFLPYSNGSERYSGGLSSPKSR